MKRFIGVDLHRKNFTVCVRSESTETVEEWSLKNLQLFAKTLKKEDSIAVEATGNTAYFVEEVGKKAGRVVVVNPHQFKVISQSVKKPDQNDAKVIALFVIVKT